MHDLFVRVAPFLKPLYGASFEGGCTKLACSQWTVRGSYAFLRAAPSERRWSKGYMTSGQMSVCTFKGSPRSVASRR